jgi:hypothetical protein
MGCVDGMVREENINKKEEVEGSIWTLDEKR